MLVYINSLKKLERPISLNYHRGTYFRFFNKLIETRKNLYKIR